MTIQTAPRETQDYRFAMMEPLGTTDEQPFFRMKITAPNGETKWMNITSSELEGILAVLAPEPYAELLAQHPGVVGFKLEEVEIPKN